MEGSQQGSETANGHLKSGRGLDKETLALQRLITTRIPLLSCQQARGSPATMLQRITTIHFPLLSSCEAHL